VHLERPWRDLEPDPQRLDRLGVEARPAERGGVGQDAGDLLARPRPARLADLLHDLDAALDDDLSVDRRLAAAARELQRLLLGLEVPVAHVLVRRVVLRADLRAGFCVLLGPWPGGLVKACRGARKRIGRPGGQQRRGHHRAGRELFHLLVARGELLQAGQDLVEQLRLAAVARDARHLLLDLDPLAGLPDEVERLGEEAQRVEVARVGLEADLQLAEGLQAVVRLVAGEVQLRGDARVRRVRLVVEQPLGDLQRVVAAPELHELPGGDGELADGAVRILRARESLREAKVRQGIGGVEVDDPPEDVDRLGVAVLTLEAGRNFVEGRERVARQPELLVELGELRRDVRVPVLELGDVFRDDLADLLVDRDGLQGEALARVELPDPLVRPDRVGIGLHLRLEVADLQQGPCVVRILLDDLLVLDDRLVVLLLLDVLLGGGEYLFAVDRHDSGCSSGSGCGRYEVNGKGRWPVARMVSHRTSRGRADAWGGVRIVKDGCARGRVGGTNKRIPLF
jgi:hypothetical protein